MFPYVEKGQKKIFIGNTLTKSTIITVGSQPNFNDLFNVLHIIKRV